MRTEKKEEEKEKEKKKKTKRKKEKKKRKRKKKAEGRKKAIPWINKQLLTKNGADFSKWFLTIFLPLSFLSSSSVALL
jgi:hypothetical protein